MSIHQSKLANGLTVVSHAMAEVETTSLGIWIGAGSRSGVPTSTVASGLTVEQSQVISPGRPEAAMPPGPR